jgi:prepilin-type N-terminal cleavage/methylation domain-containing protein
MVNRSGFTLIELLIVVVIIGILAAIAIPKFANTKGKAYVATMKSDLKNLASAQEAYYYDNSVYYAGAIPNAAFPYSPSRGVTVNILSGTVAGWSATCSHLGTPSTCGIFVGGSAPPPPATIEGSPACN